MSTQPTQPEALRLADELERDKWHVPAVVMQAAADELRRLYAENAQLREQNTALDAACAKLESVRGTQPTDDEIDALWDGKDLTIPQLVQRRIITRAALAKWGAPVVAKWAPEEIADGERGIRWVTNEGIHGRPTDHDVREYLKRTPTAHGCHCDECKQFYTTPQPVREPLNEIAANFEAMHANGDVWITTVAAAKLVRGITGGQHGTDA